jgi:hypothetical protein
VSGSSRTDDLLVASGGGAALAEAVETVVERVEAARGRRIRTHDLVPLQSGDARGLTGFYLVVGWLVGGYLVASLLGVARGARPANLRRAAIRLGSMVPYALLSGLGGALIVGPLLGALTGHLLALWWLGALLVLAAATVTMAFQVMLGVVGIGLAVLIFVILGNPSAGGAYQRPLLPGFWRAIGPALPNDAGTDGVRRIVYFAGHGLASRAIVIAAWLVAGAIVTLIGSRVRREPKTQTTPQSA